VALGNAITEREKTGTNLKQKKQRQAPVNLNKDTTII